MRDVWSGLGLLVVARRVEATLRVWGMTYAQMLCGAYGHQLARQGEGTGTSALVWGPWYCARCGIGFWRETET